MFGKRPAFRVLRVQRFQWIPCTVHRTCNFFFFLRKNNFKTESHNTIHTFKNQFATIFSVFNNNRYPNKPQICFLDWKEINRLKKIFQICFVSKKIGLREKFQICFFYEKNNNRFIEKTPDLSFLLERKQQVVQKNSRFVFYLQKGKDLLKKKNSRSAFIRKKTISCKEKLQICILLGRKQQICRENSRSVFIYLFIYFIRKKTSRKIPDLYFIINKPQEIFGENSRSIFHEQKTRDL